MQYKHKHNNNTTYYASSGFYSNEEMLIKCRLVKEKRQKLLLYMIMYKPNFPFHSHTQTPRFSIMFMTN